MLNVIIITKNNDKNVSCLEDLIKIYLLYFLKILFLRNKFKFTEKSHL